jgi:hypothetical protein
MICRGIATLVFADADGRQIELFRGNSRRRRTGAGIVVNKLATWRCTRLIRPYRKILF